MRASIGPLLGVVERPAGAEEHLTHGDVPLVEGQRAVGDQPLVRVDDHHAEEPLGKLLQRSIASSPASAQCPWTAFSDSSG